MRSFYPIKGNEAALNHNLLRDPERRQAALETIERGTMTLQGPLVLKQVGGERCGRAGAAGGAWALADRGCRAGGASEHMPCAARPPPLPRASRRAFWASSHGCPFSSKT